jgi:hypothetical protein
MRMSRRWALLVGIIPALAVSTTAHAQLKPEIETGSRVPTPPRDLKAEEAGIIRKHFAQCIYQDAKPNAMALLAHSDSSSVDLSGAKIKNIEKDLDMERCFQEEVEAGELELGLKFTPNAVRDMLAEEDYLAKHPAALQLPPDLPLLQFSPVSTDSEPLKTQALATFSDCTIRSNLAGADALLRTMPGSKNEYSAAAALAPALGACLVVGQKFGLKPANIRALVAYAMWLRFGR